MIPDNLIHHHKHKIGITCDRVEVPFYLNQQDSMKIILYVDLLDHF